MHIVICYYNLFYIDLPLEFPDGTTPVLARLYVYHGADDWTQAIPPPVAATANATTDKKDIGVVIAKVIRAIELISYFLIAESCLYRHIMV
jgi:hypothetical protein